MSVIPSDPPPESVFYVKRGAVIDAIITLLDYDEEATISGVDIRKTGDVEGWYWRAVFEPVTISSRDREAHVGSRPWARERKQRISLALNALWLIEDQEREAELNELRDHLDNDNSNTSMPF